MELLLEIAHCPSVGRCLEADDEAHPCYDVVTAQREFPGKHVLPEPWSGHLETAPILFLSSNPSIAGGELVPRKGWSDDAIVDFYANRFGGGRREWIRDGVRNLRQDGSHRKHAVRFWASVRSRAAELLGIDKAEVRPGVDYALTEVVHCNSARERGVAQALKECASRWLEPVLAASGAAVIVCLGVQVEKVIRERYSTGDAAVSGPHPIGELDRHFAFLPHPNAFKPKTFAKCLNREDLEEIRALAVAARPHRGAASESGS